MGGPPCARSSRGRETSSVESIALVRQRTTTLRDRKRAASSCSESWSAAPVKRPEMAKAQVENRPRANRCDAFADRAPSSARSVLFATFARRSVSRAFLLSKYSSHLLRRRQRPVASNHQRPRHPRPCQSARSQRLFPIAYRASSLSCCDRWKKPGDARHQARSRSVLHRARAANAPPLRVWRYRSRRLRFCLRC